MADNRPSLDAIFNSPPQKQADRPSLDDIFKPAAPTTPIAQAATPMQPAAPPLAAKPVQNAPIMAPKAPTTQPQAEQGNTAGDYASAIGRGLVSAGAGVADLATTVPYNATQFILNKVMPEKQPHYLPSISEAAEKGLTALGVPETKGTGPKVAELGAEFLGAGGGSLLKNVAKGIGAAGIEKAAKITDTLHKAATTTIEKAKNSGLVFHPQVGADLVKGLQDMPDLKTAGEAANIPQVQSLVGDIKKSIDAGDTSLRNMLGFRNKLSDISRSGGAEGAAAKKAQKILDDVVTSGKDKVIAGDKKGVKLAEDFRKQWGQYKDHENFADILAQKGDSPRAIKKELRKIYDNKDEFKKYSNEVKKYIEIGAKAQAPQVLEAVGKMKSFLGVGTGAGAIAAKTIPAIAGSNIAVPALATAGTGAILSGVAGAAGKGMARGQIEDILAAIRSGK